MLKQKEITFEPVLLPYRTTILRGGVSETRDILNGVISVLTNPEIK